MPTNPEQPTAGRRLTVIPDAAFALRQSQSGKVKNFFLEQDQGTATVERFAKKIRAYLAWFHAGRPGWEDVEYITILVVCRTAQRAEHLRQAAQAAAAAHRQATGKRTPAGLFRFTTQAHWSLEHPVAILDGRIWRTLDDHLTVDIFH